MRTTLKYKLQKNSISKFPQPGVDEAMNCAMHLVKCKGKIRDNLHQ